MNRRKLYREYERHVVRVARRGDLRPDENREEANAELIRARMKHRRRSETNLDSVSGNVAE